LAKKVADNAKNNGSDKHLASLWKHYATKKGRAPVDISVMAAIDKDLKHFRGLLEAIKDWLLSDKVVIYGHRVRWCWRKPGSIISMMSPRRVI
jgi:hypothetical protein